jgi:predicted O-methyltransferase YrrM
MAVVSPIVLGRLRTVLDGVLRRRALERAKREAWQAYFKIRPRLKLSAELQPSNRVGRFARNILRADLPRPVRYLEIGSFEGSSLAFVHTLLNGDVRITAIDAFMDDSGKSDTNWSATEATFLANVEAIGAGKVTRTLKGRSIDHLPKLIDADERFDLIFVDGSHMTLDVMSDAALAWRLLAPGGLMIFDDYWYRMEHAAQLYEPKRAVDAFIAMMAPELEVIDVAGQVFVRRIDG